MDDRAFVAAQGFILAAKTYWTREMFPALHAEFQSRAAEMDSAVETPSDVAALIAETPLYRYYAWLERHLQRFKYSGRYGLHPYHSERRDEIARALDAGALPPGLLDLDDDFEQPAYYTDVDIHQHPGGVWSDEIAGFVYERGARSTTPLAGDRHRDLHGRLVDVIAEGGTPRRLLDMGCGFGKSTQPFYDAFRETEVEAVDLAAPCLRLAARGAANAQARNVCFRQKDARRTGYDDSSFDVVTSTMLVHELPPAEIGEMLDESFRVLAPGGRMVHLDFYALRGPFDRFIHYSHARRNNEPYMEPFCEMDLEAELADRGFVDIEIRPFEEADGALAPDYPNWRFPWTLISARRPV